jgi:hypothetical protein
MIFHSSLLVYANFLSLALKCTSGFLHPEGRGSKVIRKVDILPRHYTMSKPKRPQLETVFKVSLMDNLLMLLCCCDLSLDHPGFCCPDKSEGRDPHSLMGAPTGWDFHFSPNE